ncbi:unannotated protein [freshwater metagenome]|uniref:Unannotated protein n=1 Tax=freshwater metagenome TaxID=449393 RepID=A0A6J7C9V3_9ZZZZ
MICVQRNILASKKSWLIRHIHLAGRSLAIISTSVSVVHTWHIACSMSLGRSGSSLHGMSRVALHWRATASSYNSVTFSAHTSLFLLRM